MVLPSKQELKGTIVHTLVRARDEGRLSELTVRIVLEELATHYGIEQDVFHSKTYKPFIKTVVYATMRSFEDPSDGGDETPESRKDKEEKSDSTATTGKRKHRSDQTHSSNGELAEEADVSESEAPPSKQASARSKSSKARDNETIDEPAKFGKIPKKPESESKYKSKAIIESSDEEAARNSRTPKSTRSLKEKTSRKLSLPKPKQLHKVDKDESDIEMDTVGIPGPPSSSSSSNPKPATESRRPSVSKAKRKEKTRDSMESELSSVIDEPPTKRKKKQGKEPVKAEKDEKMKRGKKKERLSKDEEMVNKLKGIVLACGMRKVWKKEFAGLDKPSQQIKRLHSILGDLGMTPRYSLEKAKAIREQRELAQELEDVQEFDRAIKRRGKAPSSSPETAEPMHEDEDPNVKAPARKKQNARASIMAFLQDQSEEE